MDKDMENHIDTMGKGKAKPSPWYYMLDGELVKRRKPCLEGDYVHLHRWQGCYRVHRADLHGFNVMKNRRNVRLGWEQFRCLKGEGADWADERRGLDAEAVRLIELGLLMLKMRLGSNSNSNRK